MPVLNLGKIVLYFAELVQVRFDLLIEHLPCLHRFCSGLDTEPAFKFVVKLQEWEGALVFVPVAEILLRLDPVFALLALLLQLFALPRSNVSLELSTGDFSAQRYALVLVFEGLSDAVVLFEPACLFCFEALDHLVAQISLRGCGRIISSLVGCVCHFAHDFIIEGSRVLGDLCSYDCCSCSDALL